MDSVGIGVEIRMGVGQSGGNGSESEWSVVSTLPLHGTGGLKRLGGRGTEIVRN